MHTIVLATQKGGSGKSTLAIGLALAAKQAGFTVRLIETDPQGTLSNWQRRRNNDDVVVERVSPNKAAGINGGGRSGGTCGTYVKTREGELDRAALVRARA